jgi:hypothetical protein
MTQCIHFFTTSFDKFINKKYKYIYANMSTPTKPTYVSYFSGMSRADRAAEKKREQQNREGWLKMVEQDIMVGQNELLKRNDVASTKGVITEIVNKFETSLPWLVRNGYNYYVQQQKGATDTIMTNNDDQSTSIFLA